MLLLGNAPMEISLSGIKTRDLMSEGLVYFRNGEECGYL